MNSDKLSEQSENQKRVQTVRNLQKTAIQKRVTCTGND